jgi:nucleoid-associated protein YgaU
VTTCPHQPPLPQASRSALDPPRAGRAQAMLLALAWCATLAGIQLALAVTAAAVPPPARLLGALGEDPEAAAMGLLHAGGRMAGWYLLVATLAGAVARACRVAGAVATLDRCTPALLRDLLDRSASLVVVVAVAVAAGGSAVARPGVPGAAEPAAAAPADGTSTSTSTTSPDPAAATSRPPPVMRVLEDPPATAVLRVLDDEPPVEPAPTVPPTPPPSAPEDAGAETPPAEPPAALTPPGDPAPGPAGAPTPAPAAPAAPVDAPAALDGPDTWVVAAGDHLWGIAEQTLADRSGARPPADATLRYLEVLVAANRGTLLDPGDPDLILPGQVFALPDPGPQ